MMLLITKKRKWQNKEKPLMWKRFTVDDIFCLWDTKKEDRELFIEKANAYHPTHIKFSGEILEIETTLLDTTVNKEEGKGTGGGGVGWGSYARICTNIKKKK